MLRKILATGVALLLASPAAAAPIVLNQWYNFGFGGVGAGLTDGGGTINGINPASVDAPATPWTFTLSSPGTLYVTDGFLSGDQFEITDFGGVIGATSAPGNGNCGNNITNCWNDATMSKGTFALAAGNHSISGTVLLSPFGSGAGFFQVVGRGGGAVPEPGTWLMMIGGFAVMGGALRRRQRELSHA